MDEACGENGNQMTIILMVILVAFTIEVTFHVCNLFTSTGLATHELHFTIIREEFKPNQKRPCEICGQIGKNYWFALYW